MKEEKKNKTKEKLTNYSENFRPHKVKPMEIGPHKLDKRNYNCKCAVLVQRKAQLNQNVLGY